MRKGITYELFKKKNNNGKEIYYTLDSHNIYVFGENCIVDSYLMYLEKDEKMEFYTYCCYSWKTHPYVITMPIKRVKSD